jgi:proton-dependent oligopeptide transporter, POT family
LADEALRTIGGIWRAGCFDDFGRLCFWLGRNQYISVPPVGLQKFVSDFKLKETQKSLLHITILYLFIAVFWALNEQYGSAWVLQASHPLMIKTISLFGYVMEVYPDQLQVLNPFFVLVFVPLFSFVLYPWLNKRFGIEALGKMSIGFFFTAISFLPIVYAEAEIQAGREVSMMWQALAFVFLMVSEVMVYGTGLEYSYSKAPKSMKSLIMGMYMLSISLGNLFTALINAFIQNPDGTSKLAGTSYYWFFIVLMTASSVGFVFVLRSWKAKGV